MQQWKNEQKPSNTTPHHCSDQRTLASNSTQNAWNAFSLPLTAAYNKQVDENKRLLNVKKLSNEIIMGKTTEDTAMELDGEGAANFEQLQDLIRKECDKHDRKYARLEDNATSWNNR